MTRQGDKERVQVLALVRMHLIALDRFLHLKNPLSEEEVEFIAEEVVEEFGGALTFADLHLVMRNAKAGRYGKFYERLSAPDVTGWFRGYYEERLDAAERSSERQAREEKTTGAALAAGMRADKELMARMAEIASKGRATVSKEEAEAEYQAYKARVREKGYRLPLPRERKRRLRRKRDN